MNKMANELKNLEPNLQQLDTKRTSAPKKTEMSKSQVVAPFRGIDITGVSGKLEHVALNTPLRFSVEALRPQSKSTSRFGSFSHHSFFSRHNPHPHRVTHIQGLNGVPICMVNDGWSRLTPLPSHPMIKGQLSTTILGVPGIQLPIGDPHSNLVPRLAIGSLSEAWREELKELAARVSAASCKEMEKKEVISKTEELRRATQYSAETGRLIPPPSRANTHHSFHQMRCSNAKNKGKEAVLSFQDQELVILELLCQILQTDSLMAIQQWLLTAGQREKDLVMGMLQTATANLQLEPQSLTTNTEERPQTQISQTTAGVPSRGHHVGRSSSTRFSQKKKQEPIPEEEKPVHIGTAEVLQFRSSQEEKQNQPDPTS
ncbi:PREDICTED: protein TBATA [Gavialis gangeticus]|uniref:protein TBATA n=1 Tax=Gavialis gangeticus TaxID=94835 RepID=UPI00092F0B96|nr:PREDICTED: protein TBATA [Gavialis gangeticus]